MTKFRWLRPFPDQANNWTADGGWTSYFITRNMLEDLLERMLNVQTIQFLRNMAMPKLESNYFLETSFDAGSANSIEGPTSMIFLYCKRFQQSSNRSERSIRVWRKQNRSRHYIKALWLYSNKGSRSLIISPEGESFHGMETMNAFRSLGFSFSFHGMRAPIAGWDDTSFFVRAGTHYIPESPLNADRVIATSR